VEPLRHPRRPPTPACPPKVRPVRTSVGQDDLARSRQWPKAPRQTAGRSEPSTCRALRRLDHPAIGSEGTFRGLPGAILQVNHRSRRIAGLPPRRGSWGGHGERGTPDSTPGVTPPAEEPLPLPRTSFPIVPEVRSIPQVLTVRRVRRLRRQSGRVPQLQGLVRRGELVAPQVAHATGPVPAQTARTGRSRGCGRRCRGAGRARVPGGTCPATRCPRPGRAWCGPRVFLSVPITTTSMSLPYCFSASVTSSSQGWCQM